MFSSKDEVSLQAVFGKFSPQKYKKLFRTNLNKTPLGF